MLQLAQFLQNLHFGKGKLIPVVLRVESLLPLLELVELVFSAALVGIGVVGIKANLCQSITLACAVWPAPEAPEALLRAEGWPTPSGRWCC